MKSFESFIAIPPGVTIKDELEYLKMIQHEFSLRMGMSEKFISQLINGEAPLTYDTALKLESVLGIDASFWNNLESHYREALSGIKQTEEITQELEICIVLPMPPPKSR